MPRCAAGVRAARPAGCASSPARRSARRRNRWSRPPCSGSAPPPAAAIERVLADLNERLGRQWDCKVDVVVSIDAGRAVVGEIAACDPPTVMAMGEAMQVAGELRKAVTAARRFAISERVYAA